jgi:hypothetical protein
VLETGKIELEQRWLSSTKVSAVWVHRTVRWCTGQCPVCQAGSGELAALKNELAAYGYNSLDCPVCTGLSGEPTVGRANGRLHDLRETRGRANGREGHRTVRCAPDSVRCANGSQVPTVDFVRKGKKSAPDSIRCAPDCPVR